MTLASKRIQNLPPRLSYVSSLPDITQKPQSYIVFLSMERVALNRTVFGVWSGYLNRLRRNVEASCYKQDSVMHDGTSSISHNQEIPP